MLIDLGEAEIENRRVAEPISRVGLLQPITLTPDGVLVCGWRRYHALRRLGHRTTNVWIRSGLTDRLGQLLAEQEFLQTLMFAHGGLASDGTGQIEIALQA